MYGKWYMKLMQGVCERMGNNVRLDLGMSIELLHTSLIFLDKWYIELKDPVTRKRLVAVRRLN